MNKTLAWEFRKTQANSQVVDSTCYAVKHGNTQPHLKTLGGLGYVPPSSPCPSVTSAILLFKPTTTSSQLTSNASLLM